MSKVRTYELRTLFTLVMFAVFMSLCVFAGTQAYGEVGGHVEWPVEEIDIIVEEEPVIEAEPEEEEIMRYFDVPLDEDLQDHIFALCEERGFDPAIVVAMIERESDFNPSNMGDGGNSYGLMQIQSRWHQSRMDKLGCGNLLDPYQNITVGLDYLVELSEAGKGIEWVLMAYNGGPSYANRKAGNGEISGYASWVLEKSVEYRNKRSGLA